MHGVWHRVLYFIDGVEDMYTVIRNGIRIRLFFLLLIGFLVLPASAQAYVDPGTASIILQSVLGTIAVVFGLLLSFRQRIRSLFSKRNPEDENKNK